MNTLDLIQNLNEMKKMTSNEKHRITLDIAKTLIKDCSKHGKLCLTKDQFDKEVN